MNYLSVCSGIEAATVAWHHMGWNPLGFSEIEKFPSQVLAHHYPNVTNFGDMTKFKDWNINDTVELLVGGTPCQSFSVAGLRKGLEDPRGNLMLTYLAMADHFKPKWILWENVPGVLSSNKGSDFAALLQGLAELGYGFSYRVLDAQYFGVPQRRRRVFVVGCLGDWRSAAKVLFESESLQRDITPSRSEGKGSSAASETSTGASDNEAGDRRVITMSNGQANAEIAYNRGTTLTCIHEAPIVTYSLQGSMIGRDDKNVPQGNGINKDVSFTLNATDRHAIVYEMHPADSRVTEMGNVCQTLTTRMGTGGGNVPLVQAVGVGEQPYTAHCLRSGASRADKPSSTTYIEQAVDVYNGSIQGYVAATLTTASGTSNASSPKAMISTFKETSDCLTAAYGTKWNGNASATNGSLFAKQNMRVRRLTPIECERLQGFPDNYTNITNAPDTGRYKALGNSMAVPVMRWIGERIREVENAT